MILLSDDDLRARALENGARDYQAQKIVEVVGQLRDHRSTLMVMATGLGKTITFAVLAMLWPGRVLVLAHRRELIQQAWTQLTRLTGERVGIEKAHEHSYGARIVVGSVQTLKEARLNNISEPPFDLVIVDEAHHCVAKTYRKILTAFPAAKVLGVTATPDRGDKKAMGRVFESVAGEALDMLWGIDNGWLVPLDIRPVRAEINLDKVRVSKGEFNQGELDDAIAAAAAEISRATIEAAGPRRTVMFCPGVKTAHATAEACNLIEPGSAYSLDGATPDDERASLLRRHKSGGFPRLSNCQVLTEGYDDPELICGLIAIPCKTRGRYAQMIGRLTRLWPGIDKLPTIEERKAAVAASPKPYGVVFDLVGNATKHDLVSPVDILGGTYTDEERAKAKKKLRDQGGDVRAALEEARAEIKAAAARAARKRVKVTIGDSVDPFKAFGARDPEPRLRAVRPEDAATPGQLWFLRQKLRIAPPEGCTKRQAGKLIAIGKQRQSDGLCSYEQVAWLDRFGINGRQLPEHVGREIANAYRASSPVPAERQMPPKAEIDGIIARASENSQQGVAE